MKMWCLVSQPNSVILEVDVDPKAKGQECLEKICHCLGISHESDYFGLKFHSPKGEELWLNLRNPIERQVGGVPPFRFALRVKFWVPPHLLLQEATRHQFYLNARLELVEGRLHEENCDNEARLVALISQAESGDYKEDDLSVIQQYSKHIQLCSDCSSCSTDFFQSVVHQYRSLMGMKAAAAEYWILKMVSQLPGCGEELFHTRLNCGDPGPSLGVGPHGLTIYTANKSQDKECIPYSAVVSTASNKRQLVLRYLSLDGAERMLEVKLDSSIGSSGLYRAITEKHAFYSCETVRDAVTTQSIRDLKGTIASIFKEDSTLGLKYVFDIRRTCREVYDNARRALYQNPSKKERIGELTDSKIISQSENSYSMTSKVCHICTTKTPVSRDGLSRVVDAMLCRICMDQGIDTAFFPCAHVISCGSCAKRCELCPLCRATIDEAKHIFLPLELSSMREKFSLECFCKQLEDSRHFDQ